MLYMAGRKEDSRYQKWNKLIQKIQKASKYKTTQSKQLCKDDVKSPRALYALKAVKDWWGKSQKNYPN